MKKLITLCLAFAGMVGTASATTLHIGVELNYTGNLKVYRYGGTVADADVWENSPLATFDGVKYGRRWYSIDMNGNNTAIIRMEENNWNDRAEISEISGDDCYIYVSTTESGKYKDGQKVWNSGKLSSQGWQTMKFSNDVDGKWDDEANACQKIDDNTFTYTLTKEQITNANKSSIYFRFKLADGVFFVGENYWTDHYFRIGSNGNGGNVPINIANSITNNSYTTDQEKNWVLTVPACDYEKIVFTIKDVTSGTQFGNSTWKVSADAYISKTVTADNKYATFGTSVPVALSGLSAKGVTAYTVTANATTGVITKKEKSDALAANEGVLLQNTTNSDVTLSIPVAASAEPSASNSMAAFTGAERLTQPTTGKETYYILAKENETDGVGFYKVNETSGNTMGANTAYLKVTTTGSDARSFLWFDEATGINAVESAKLDGDAYNLAGQRVAQPTKGLYIVNGKKVIMK